MRGLISEKGRSAVLDGHSEEGLTFTRELYYQFLSQQRNTFDTSNFRATIKLHDKKFSVQVFQTDFLEN